MLEKTTTCQQKWFHRLNQSLLSLLLLVFGSTYYRIALININLPDSAFKKYESSPNLTLGLRIDDLVKIIKNSQDNDSVELSFKSDSLNIKTIGTYTCEHQVILNDTSWRLPSIPELTFDSRLVISTPTFERILTDIGTITDNINLETNARNSRVTFSGNSNKGNVMIKLEGKSNNENILELIVKNDSICTYKTEYLLRIVKAISDISNRVTVEFSSAKPIKLEFVILNSVKLQFYLAPRL
jgi:proliferating cell nuclear antigen